MSEARATAAKPKAAKGRLIEVRGLDKTFYDADREVRVLRNLDFKVEAGEEIAIVGQSGTGKSTLLHIIGSLEEPTAAKSISTARIYSRSIRNRSRSSAM